LALALTACTPPTATREYSDVSASTPRNKTDQETASTATEEPKPAEPPARSNPDRAKHNAQPSNTGESTAVLALMREADSSSASGRLDNAAATLERAIRIQPRNAQLWNKLAEVRLQQHQPGLAEDLAKKSNLLAKDNKALTRKNWSIIANARRQKGDAQGASEADAKAKQ